jgi:hypothetical protein
MKKLLSLLGAIGLTTSSAAAVIACGNTIESSTTSLEDIFKDLDLGNFEFDDLPTPQQILERTKEKNQNIDINQLEVQEQNLKNGTVIIRVRDEATDYPHDSTITLKYKNKLTLIINNRELGIFNAQPIAQQIIDQAVSLNKNLNSVEVEATINNSTTATINVKKESEVYISGGTVEVTFTVASAKTDLGTVIAEENRALGGFNSTPTSVQILNRRV